MPNKDQNENKTKKLPNKSIKIIKEKEEAEFNSESASHKRKMFRLEIIKASINICFFLFGLTIVILALDILFFDKSIAETNTLTILIAVISATLTTLVGVVIGSTVD